VLVLVIVIVKWLFVELWIGRLLAKTFGAPSGDAETNAASPSGSNIEQGTARSTLVIVLFHFYPCDLKLESHNLDPRRDVDVLIAHAFEAASDWGAQAALPAVVGSLPTTITFRQAAEKHRLAACAPQNSTRGAWAPRSAVVHTIDAVHSVMSIRYHI
jgi:hypothetical protein